MREVDLYLVVPNIQIDQGKFKLICAEIRDKGGWYSRKWGLVPGGFAFESLSTAQTFAYEHFGKADDVEVISSKKDDIKASVAFKENKEWNKKVKEAEKTDAIAERLKNMADAMQKDIDDKRSSLTQNPTPRRLKIKARQEKDADKLELVQETMRALAKAYDNNNVPDSLKCLVHKSKITTLLTNSCGLTPDQKKQRNMLLSMQAANESDEDKQTKKDRRDRKELEDMENNVRLQKIPGFFPTPRITVERMIDNACIEDGVTVCEPSAGIGSILESLRSQFGHKIKLSAIEQNPQLCDIIKKKGFSVDCCDFLKTSSTFDRFIMNPPFEKKQDIKHIEHAYRLLNPGGVLVSLCSAVHFQGKNMSDIRKLLLDSNNGYWEMLPEKSFTGPDSFRYTGVNVAMVVLHKTF
jgi:hypothetical protein